jgi:hypothetical protein
MSGKSLAVFLVLVLAVFLALRPFSPPPPIPADAPQNTFSAERALQDLSYIARQPHPVGTQEHSRVRDYLLQRLRSLGLDPQVQAAVGVVPRLSTAGSVENVVARLPGLSEHQRAVLFDAHYDSVPSGPGVADDGAGVAALLETIRALRTGPPLKRDLIFLFSDGEEDGLLGAAAFMEHYPWAQEVKLAINFEARGNSGAPMLFETSEGSGSLIDLIARALPRLDGTSISDEIYHRMPNDTDLSVIMSQGAAGLNFAFAGHWEAYHSRLDDIPRLNRGSLQQQGNYALHLARAFGNSDLTRLKTEDEVYFNPWQGGFIHYHVATAIGFAIAVFLLFIGLCLFLWRRRSLSGLDFVLAILITLAMAACLLVASFAYASGVHLLHRDWLRTGNVIFSRTYAAALLVLLLGIWLVLYLVLRRKVSPVAVGPGIVAPWVVLLLAAAFASPGASYLLVWPIAWSLLSIILMERYPSLAQLAAVPIILLLVPLIPLFFASLGLTLGGAIGLGAVMSLLLSLLTPQIEALHRLWPRVTVSLIWALFLALFLSAMAVVRYSPSHPQAVNLTYALDPVSSQAVWSGDAETLNRWSIQYLGRHPKKAFSWPFSPPESTTTHLLNPAPTLVLPPPEARLLSDQRSGGFRDLSLQIVSPRHAREIAVWTDNPVIESTVDGNDYKSSTEWALRYVNVPRDGFILKVRIPNSAPLRLFLVDRSLGVPDIPGRHFQPRPPNTMQQHFGDRTLVRNEKIF